MAAHQLCKLCPGQHFWDENLSCALLMEITAIHTTHNEKTSSCFISNMLSWQECLISSGWLTLLIMKEELALGKHEREWGDLKTHNPMEKVENWLSHTQQGNEKVHPHPETSWFICSVIPQLYVIKITNCSDQFINSYFWLRLGFFKQWSPLFDRLNGLGETPLIRKRTADKGKLEPGTQTKMFFWPVFHR